MPKLKKTELFHSNFHTMVCTLFEKENDNFIENHKYSTVKQGLIKTGNTQKESMISQTIIRTLKECEGK